jgi:hypothetical protein
VYDLIKYTSVTCMIKSDTQVARRNFNKLTVFIAKKDFFLQIYKDTEFKIPFISYDNFIIYMVVCKLSNLWQFS